MRPRTPPLFATGYWVIDPPFSVANDVSYVCKAIRTFADIEASGVDPFTAYYLYKGVGRERYEQDYLNLASIVTLMSDTMPTLYVPDSYIVRFPETTAVPYDHVVLSCTLGAIPRTLPLENLKTTISELVLTELGIITQVREHVASPRFQAIDQVTHMTLENNRLARLDSVRTPQGRLAQLELQYERLQEQNQILEKLVLDNGLLP